MLNKTSLYSKYPWLKPNGDAHDLVIGDDLDAALSAVLFLHFHPNAKISGIYSKYTAVYYAATCAWTDVLKGVWLDLDIYHAASRSIGHHIVRLDARQNLPGFQNSLNLNDLWRKSLQHNFDEKYPLGTVHFLMWLYRQEIPEIPNADLLLWLADSAYINAQSTVYRKRGGQWRQGKGFKWNVKSWLYGAIQVKSLQRTFEAIDTLAFEERMREFQETLKALGFVQGEGQVASHHLKLYGYQCQPVGDIGDYIRNLLDVCAYHTGWTYAPQQVAGLGKLQAKTGKRFSKKLDQLPDQNLAVFLQANDVFSYVFTHFDTINYTTGIADGGSLR